jgi:cell division septal protein FtsQ
MTALLVPMAAKEAGIGFADFVWKPAGAHVDDLKQLNAVAAGLALIAAGALARGALAWLLRQPAFEFRDVVVMAPLERANAAHVEAVDPRRLAGTFTMNPKKQAALARVPWVRKVALRRQWRAAQ